MGALLACCFRMSPCCPRGMTRASICAGPGRNNSFAASGRQAAAVDLMDPGLAGAQVDRSTSSALHGSSLNNIAPACEAQCRRYSVAIFVRLLMRRRVWPAETATGQEACAEASPDEA